MPTSPIEWFVLAGALGATGLALALAFQGLRAFRLYIASQRQVLRSLEQMLAQVGAVRDELQVLEERVDTAERLAVRAQDPVAQWGSLAGSATG